MITLLNFKRKHGSVIYLNNYLSVMFNTSDVLIDKEEIAMNMKLPLQVPDTAAEACVPKSEITEQIGVSEEQSCVPKPHMTFIIQKVAELL